MKSAIKSTWKAGLFPALLAIAAMGTAHGDVLTVGIPAGQPSIVKSAGVDKLSVPEFGTIQVPGKPQMPARTFYICVPPDADVSGVTFEGASEWIDGEYDIEPGGMRLNAQLNTQEEQQAALSEYEANHAAVYGKDDPFPVQRAEFLGDGGYRKYKLVRIRFSPWQYHPKSGRILFTPELTVHVEYKRTKAIDASVNMSDTVGEDQARSLLLNYDEAQQWYSVQTNAMSAGDMPAGSYNTPYVVMCTDATRDAIEPLIDWKRSIGMRVRVFTKEELEADPTYSSYELERKIRYYLRDNYATWGAQYFLIVGDTDVIPMRACTAGDGGTWESHTDTYYGELTSTDSASWDNDWDGNYAERTEDNIDWVMELDVGRIPDNDPADIEYICEKIRTFEMDTARWKENGLFCSAIWTYANMNGGGGAKSDHAYVSEEMFGDWSWTGWLTRTMYEQGGLSPSVFASDRDLTREETTNYWGGGQFGLVNLGGHGAGSVIARRLWNWDDGDGVPEDGEVGDTGYFWSNDCATLGDDYPSIVAFAACSCGDYDDEHAVAKELLHSGGVTTWAAAGNVQLTVPWLDESYGRIQTFQYLFNKNLVADGERVGSSLMSTKTDFAASYNWDDGCQQILLNNNLYGDPALLREGTDLRPNLDYYRPEFWDYCIVPRNTNDATSTWCPPTATLPGNSNGTYLNMALENNGDVTTYQCYNRMYVDDVYVAYVGWSWIDAGAHSTLINLGTATVRGGRHTLKAVYDPFDETTESNESDNSWSRQYVWSPYQLDDGTSVYRSAPPVRGSLSYDNCDGFQTEDMGSGEWWAAVGILHSNDADDYDIRLCDDYVGSENGFDSYSVNSGYGAGNTDFVLINRNITGSTGPFYPGVIRYSGGSSAFRITQNNSPAQVLYVNNSYGTFDHTAYSAVHVHEVYVPTNGHYVVRLDNLSGTAELAAGLYGRDAAFYSRSDYLATGYAPSDGADLEFEVYVSDPGYYAIAVWKQDEEDYGKANTYDLTMMHDDYYEENDTLATAYTGFSEQTWLNTVDGYAIQSDNDYYEVYISSGFNRLVVECDHVHAEGNINIAVYNSAGTWIGSSYTETDDEFLDLVLPTSGENYYICAYYGDAGNEYDLWWDDLGALDAPTGVAATDGSHTDKVLVSWSVATGGTHYKVWRATSAAGTKTEVSGWITGTSFNDIGATPGATYYYFVQAASSSGGDLASGYSAYDDGWRALLPPTGVSASDGTYTDKVRVTWNLVTGASHYHVTRSETAGGAKDSLSIQTTTLFDDTTAVPGVTYYYFVQAGIDASGTHSSDYSAYNTGWRALLTAPWLDIVAEGSSNIVVSWSPDDPGWLLQETDDLMTNWWDSASGSINPVVIPSTNAAMFYRLRRE